MPIRSKAQRRWLYAAEARGELPKGTAERWEAHTPKEKPLPERLGEEARLEKAANRLRQILRTDPTRGLSLEAFRLGRLAEGGPNARAYAAPLLPAHYNAAQALNSGPNPARRGLNWTEYMQAAGANQLGRAAVTLHGDLAGHYAQALQKTLPGYRPVGMLGAGSETAVFRALGPSGQHVAVRINPASWGLSGERLNVPNAGRRFFDMPESFRQTVPLPGAAGANPLLRAPSAQIAVQQIGSLPHQTLLERVILNQRKIREYQAAGYDPADLGGRASVAAVRGLSKYLRRPEARSTGFLDRILSSFPSLDYVGPSGGALAGVRQHVQDASGRWRLADSNAVGSLGGPSVLQAPSGLASSIRDAVRKPTIRPELFPPGPEFVSGVRAPAPASAMARLGLQQTPSVGRGPTPGAPRPAAASGLNSALARLGITGL